MITLCRFVVLAFIILCSKGWAQVVPSLALASPLDGTVIQPGQSLTVEVKGSNLPSDGQEVVIGDIPIGISQTQPAGNDLTFQLIVPSDVQPGTYALWSVVRASSGDTLSRSVVLKVMPNYQLTGLGFDKGILALAGPGRQSVLSAFGYSVGQRQILDNEFLSFASADPTIASVDANGVVTAIAAGKTIVSATYGTVSGSITVLVGSSVIGMPITATPTILPPSGSFTAPFTATITDATPGSAIYYTLDGSTPTATSNAYSGALSVAATETLQAVAIASGYTQSPVASAKYAIASPVTATPTFSPGAGTFTAAQTVTISDGTLGAAVYYTTNGAIPTINSTLYSGPIPVSTTETIQAIAVASGYVNSTVASAAYTINVPVAATPTFSPAAGTFTVPQTVTISDTTSGSAVYYTTNGTSPTTNSALYSGSITVGSTETIQAIAVASGYNNSAVASATYTITLPTAATPTFTPAAGVYTGTQSVSIADSTPGVSIYYTTNGSAPSVSSIRYTGPISVSSSETIQATAIETGYASSAVAVAAYTINAPVAATPTFSPSAGTYQSAQTVTMGDATPGATIYYTRDGTTPTTSSTVYAGAISIATTATVQAIAVVSGYTQSPVATAVYTINAPQDFTLGLSTTELTVSSGHTGTATVTATPVTTFSQPITFSCSGLPAILDLSCTFSPSTLTPNGAVSTTTLMVKENATALLLRRSSSVQFAGLFGLFAISTLGFRRRKLGRAVLSAVLFTILAAGLSLGCGGASTAKVTVNASSGALSHSSTFVLTIR